MYATALDLRNEGVTEAQASDERLTALIEEATQVIDRLTGWFFEPRQLTLTFDGRGTKTIEPPVPPIRLDLLFVDGVELSRAPNDLLVVGAPVEPWFVAPRFTLLDGNVFSKGIGNVSAQGVWGYTEADGTPFGRTPLAIRRACMMLALRMIPSLTDDAAEETRNRWRIIEERTRDQSYKLDKPAAALHFTGDPEIDDILLRYRRPWGLGAV